MCRSIKLALAAAIVVAAAAPSITAHPGPVACNGQITAVEVGAETIYNDHRQLDADGWNTWVYLETNNHPGLQTGGSHALLAENGDDLGFTDPCVNGHTTLKDSIVF